MNVLVQHLETRMYLAADGRWVKSKEASAMFPDAMNAIAFCIQKSLREVRLVTAENGVHFYPFGKDPVARQERKRLRKLVAENRRLQSRAAYSPDPHGPAFRRVQRIEEAVPFQRQTSATVKGA